MDRVVAQANEAINEFVSPFGLNHATLETIRTKHGLATFSLVCEVYRSAMDFPVDWSTTTLEEAIVRVRQNLEHSYPFLTQESIRCLENCFAYSWK